ncbi:DUF3606 domain-containing protein [Variovorax sp. J22P271]|uniref:DUF3606 domain-containing protein n=1 Tax=Variovorax davisae TaxID=3053515 RepID=UPI0025780DC0|nr:DUF3606 domain-containing protein [Variovorax sp. J22P271]MDM0035714.1 DUF3606 domain-containing protein [Variovorax sp. J22P271]
MTDESRDIPPDVRRINVDVLHEVRSWMFTLGCTEAELRLAVRAVGDSPDAVRAYLHDWKG